MNTPDLTLLDAPCPVPAGVSLAYVLVVDYRGMYPFVACHLQIVRNNEEALTLLP